MYAVDAYYRVRRACQVEGKSIRRAAKEFGINRRTVSKMLEHSIPPGYKREEAPNHPKLNPYLEFIDQILSDDKTQPKKQRHTIKRIFDRLQEERDFDGGYNTVRDYVAKQRIKSKEMFCPLLHPPGSAQVDFGEAWVIISGMKQKAHCFVMDLPQSDACFVKAYPRENTESFCDGHVSAFTFFNGVPTKILYDNTKIAVSRILGDGKRKKTRAFCELQSHYLFADGFARVGKGNDKGKVENLVGYARRNFMVPLPEFESFEALNVHLETCCLKRQQAILQKHKESIGERLTKDQAAFLPLPAVPYDACECQAARVSSQSLVRYKGNDYSVPVRYGYLDVWVKGCVQKVVISCGTKVIAEHERSYGQSETIFNPLHYLPLLEQKVGAFDQAAPLAKWDLPRIFHKLKAILEARQGKAGKREYVKVLRLLESFKLEEVEVAICETLNLGASSFEAIKHVLLCLLDARQPQLNLLEHPHLPVVTVQTTVIQDYHQLLR
jgi:transposase